MSEHELDLDVIRQLSDRYGQAAALDGHVLAREVPALIAEVERLRGELEKWFEVPAHDWGAWQVSGSVLQIDPAHPVVAHYGIEIERLNTSEAVLDFICQVAAKTWADAPLVAGLVWALADVINPQKNLCAWGMNGRTSGDEVAGLRRLLASARATSYLNPDGTHRYLSTGCLHGNHIYCQTAVTRADGTAKVPATCKECGSPCVCIECAHVATGDQT